VIKHSCNLLVNIVQKKGRWLDVKTTSWNDKFPCGIPHASLGFKWNVKVFAFHYHINHSISTISVTLISQYYRSIRSYTLFSALRYFSLFKLKVFSNRVPLVCFSFHLPYVITNRLPCFHSRHFSFTLFQEVSYFPWSVLTFQDNFLDPFLYLPFVYKAPCSHQ